MAEILDEIKGLSIESVHRDRLVFWSSKDLRRMVTERTNVLNFYIGTKGTIFQYDRNREGMINTTAVAVEKAGVVEQFPGRGVLYAWTLVDGHLTQIRQYIGGFSVLTVAIDPDALTCTLAFRMEGEPNASDIWDYDVTNSYLIQVLDRRMNTFQCSVSRGNIFAPDK